MTYEILDHCSVIKIKLKADRLNRIGWYGAASETLEIMLDDLLEGRHILRMAGNA